MKNPLPIPPINPTTSPPPFPPPIPPISSSFCFILPHHRLLMAAGFPPAKSQSVFKPLNPNADPFLAATISPLPPPPLPAYTLSSPLHVGSLMSDYGNLYYPRAAYYWQFDPYPAVSCYDARSQLVWPHQVGFSSGAVHDRKLANMEICEAFGPRNGSRLKRDFVVSSRPRRKMKSAQWVEKKENMMEKISSDPVDLSYTITPCSVDCSEITTVMMKNIPNQFKRRDLLQLLDRYCQVANQKGDSQPDFCISEYDFVYLPMDFRRFWDEGKVSNLGYAFVNFTSSTAASQFCRVYHNYKWEVNVNKKICEITGAKIQGREALRNAFKNKIFWCHADHYLPVILSPASDGYRRYKIANVGRRIPSPPRKPLKKLCQ